jgi:hypothetical protein
LFLLLFATQVRIHREMNQYSAVVFLFLSGSFLLMFGLLVVSILRVFSSKDHNAFFYSECLALAPSACALCLAKLAVAC